MEQALTAREIDEWFIYDAMFGLPDKRDDIRAGTIAASLYNVQPKKRGTNRKRITALDFFPSLQPEKRQSSSVDLQTKWAAAMGLPPKEPAADEHDRLDSSLAGP